MDTNYRINRFYLIFATLLFLVLIYLTAVETFPVGEKVLRLSIEFIFLYAIGILYTDCIVLTENSIINKIYLFPFYPKVRECKFSDISKITYKFFFFEEAGTFIIFPSSLSKSGPIGINFLVNNKKEIIETILKERPDLHIENWIKESVLNYKIIRKKFLIISLIIITAAILILILQMNT